MLRAAASNNGQGSRAKIDRYVVSLGPLLCCTRTMAEMRAIRITVRCRMMCSALSLSSVSDRSAERGLVHTYSVPFS